MIIKKWEYKTEYITNVDAWRRDSENKVIRDSDGLPRIDDELLTRQILDLLNKNGEDGWELIGDIDTYNSVDWVLFFKRSVCNCHENH